MRPTDRLVSCTYIHVSVSGVPSLSVGSRSSSSPMVRKSRNSSLSETAKTSGGGAGWIMRIRVRMSVVEKTLGGIVHSVLGFPNLWLRSAFAAIVVVVAGFGTSSFFWHAATSLKHPLSSRGVRHWVADAPLVDFIHKIDVAGPDASSTLMMFTTPEIAMEVRHVRVMSNVADFQTLEELKRTPKRGKVPKLYVVIQKDLVAAGKGAAILRSFVAYPADSWTETSVGGYFVYFSDVGSR